MVSFSPSSYFNSTSAVGGHSVYRIPLPTAVCVILLTPTILTTILIMLLSSYSTILVSLLSTSVSILLYTFYVRKVDLVEAPSHDVEVTLITRDREIT